MRKAILNALIAFHLIAGAASPQSQVPNDLAKLGEISAEIGEFAFLNNLVTAYSDRDIFVEIGNHNKRDLLTSRGGPVSFELKNASMRKVKDNVPEAVAHEFQFCDPLDQVSIHVEESIRAIIPKEAKVKDSETLLDRRILVIYSVPGDEHYKILLSVLKSTPGGGYVVVGDGEVSQYGRYCGKQVVTTDIRAILVDEPSGSSDFSAVYFFAIRGLDPSTKK